MKTHRVYRINTHHGIISCPKIFVKLRAGCRADAKYRSQTNVHGSKNEGDLPGAHHRAPKDGFVRMRTFRCKNRRSLAKCCAICRK